MKMESGMKRLINRKIQIASLFLILIISCNQEKTSQYYNGLAVKELKEGRYQEAYTSFSRVIELDSINGQAYYMRAQVLGLLNGSKDSICYNLSKAVELGFKEAIKVKEKFCSEIPKEEFDSLKNELDRFINENPKKFEGFYNRANMYFDVGNFENAIMDYNQAIDLQEYPVAYYNRGICYIRIGKKEEGCKDIKKSALLGYNVKQELLDFCNQ
jgi:tetratricopeptide (TPR) repeat protein